MEKNIDREMLQRYIEGRSGQQEKESIIKWLEADEKHMQEFLLLRNIYDVTLWGYDPDESNELCK